MTWGDWLSLAVAVVVLLGFVVAAERERRGR
jgi:hypothetical protein